MARRIWRTPSRRSTSPGSSNESRAHAPNSSQHDGSLELRAGVESYPYLQRALDRLGEEIPVRTLDDSTEALASDLEARLDPGEASAFAVADSQNGTLVTDDGPARKLARDDGVPVTGSIGVLIIAVEADRVSKSDADRWLKQWIDDTEYRAPSRDLSDYL